ncbi:hypothetical protein BDZ89DRAFT_1100636 [Hymenopellis radicata]|nr:hypothetical protein BDZ89DRAFT_1100636 [Hymenopellis radicata]
MSAHAYTDDFSHPQYQDRSPYIPTHPSLSTDSHEVKASYDDLIDEYASPYAANARHQTFTVDTPIAAQHRRGPSLPQKPSKRDTFQDPTNIGYPPLPTDPEVEPAWTWRKLIPESLACRMYIVVVLVQTTIDIAIEADLFLRINAATNGSTITSKKMSTYLVLFGMAHVFQFAMAVDAVYFRNTLEFMCLTGFNTLLLAYSILQIGEVREALNNVGASGEGISNIPINVLTAIIPCVVGAAELAFILLAWKIYHEFGWKVYKFLGADRRIKKMYANYQIYECLIKFDIFFWAGFSVQFIVLVLSEADWEFYVTCAALPLSLLLLFEGHIAARYENKWMMATFMSGCVGAMIYFVYKLTKVLMYRTTDFAVIWKSLSVFSVIAIGLLLLTFIFSVITMRNFGRGLKDSLTNRTTGHNRFNSKGGGHNRAASANPNRMSID